MPRYYFNIYNGSDIHDEAGTDLKDAKEMRFYMMTLATEMLLNNELQKEVWEMEVLNESGQIVASMRFGKENDQ